MTKQYDFNPTNRAFTGGVGKPTKPRRNDGRPTPWSPMGVQHGMSVYPHSTTIYSKLEPYASTKLVTRNTRRAPTELTPLERQRWHKLRKLGLV